MLIQQSRSYSKDARTGWGLSVLGHMTITNIITRSWVTNCTKLASVELRDEDKPCTKHVCLEGDGKSNGPDQKKAQLQLSELQSSFVAIQ